MVKFSLQAAKTVHEKRVPTTSRVSKRKAFDEEINELKKEKLELEIEEKRLHCVQMQLTNEKLEFQVEELRRKKREEGTSYMNL